MKYFLHRVSIFKTDTRSLHLLRKLLLVLIMTMQLACTATPLPPYEAAYTTKLRGIKITGTRKFESTGENSYKVSWRAKALWMRLNEWSEFELVNGNEVRPISYHYTRNGLGSDRPIHIYFDWENNVINASTGKEQYQLLLKPGTLDKLSYQVQMQMDLLANPNAQSFTYSVANHDRLKDYEFNYQATHSIDTQLGAVDALLFKRQKNARKSTEIWLSPLQYYLPVRIVQTDDGDQSVAAIKYWKSDAGTNSGENLGLSTLGGSLAASAENNQLSDKFFGAEGDDFDNPGIYSPDINTPDDDTLSNNTPDF